MEATLNIKGIILILDDSVQLSPNGRDFRLSSIESIGVGKWIDKVLCTGTIYRFRFLDCYAEFIGFEFDEYGVFKRVLKKS